MVILQKIEFLYSMQEQQDRKEASQERFAQIDKRWSVVEDALRIQSQERTQDLCTVKGQLQQRVNQVASLQSQKGQLTMNTLQVLHSAAVQSKQNLAGLFETEAQFRVDHLDKKNQFIQSHLQSGGNFNNSLQQYSTNKIGDICGRLQAIDSANRLKTEQTLKELKQEVIGEAQTNFAKEKDRYFNIMSKISADANKQLDELRDLMRAGRKKREQSEGKLQLMVDSLIQELSHLSAVQEKQGQMTYDCLLKLLEECCGKIQEAQLR